MAYERPSRNEQILIWESNLALCFRSLPGIIAAGGIYPLTFIAIMTASMNWHFEVPFYLGLILSVCVSSFFGFFIGVLIALTTGVISILFLNGLNCLLGNLFNVRSLVGASGALAGYAPTAAVMLGRMPADSLVFFLIGPLLAMLIGFLGATIYFDWRYFEEIQEHQNATCPNLQFKISHLLLAMTFAATVIGISQLAGNLMFAILVGVWCALQPIMALGYQWFGTCVSPQFFKHRTL